jgi:hypothetical protein
VSEPPVQIRGTMSVMGVGLGWRTSTLAAAVAVSACSAPATAERPPPRPPKLYAQSGKARVPAAQGSYCATSDPDPEGSAEGVCADALYPLRIRRRLRTHRRASITLTATQRLDSVVVCTVVPDRAGERRKGCHRAVARAGGSWRTRVPNLATRVGRLGVSVTFHSEGKRPGDASGSADYEIGLRLPGKATARQSTRSGRPNRPKVPLRRSGSAASSGQRA